MQLKLKVKYGKKKFLQLRFNINKLKKIKEQRKWIELNKEKSSLNDKIFCIGFAKTGTTSLEKALINFGYQMGNQYIGEIFVEDWYKKRYDRIINLSKSAEAFQDAPFGLPELYKILDKEFENSKFILTIRNDENQWFSSLIKYHSKMFADGVRIPTKSDLENATYIYKGYALDTKKMIYNFPEIPLYDAEYYKKKYLKHNEEVKKYFKDRSQDLLILNISKENIYQKLANFLNIKVNKNDKFPWANKTSDYQKNK